MHTLRGGEERDKEKSVSFSFELTVMHLKVVIAFHQIINPFM